ncbi:hypothetical protein GCM10010123_41490 [Pilimelia anulata]|uniref:Uncharacterized protein n=1 Tax=Pilimelia anulata TaxID=53371 RepID=A0A8J3BGD2_9ACTN|nr:hypothetical protein [Pilimelia anulata]GGK07315.1 hypothetical protein GCM10010123_41490 [Pilimelia anulata]
MVTNPFHVPGAPAATPLRCTLRPWAEPGHAEYWVDVGGAGAARAAFGASLALFVAGLGDPRGNGRLVTVGGESATGKSSLIHQCIHDLMAAVAGEPAAGGGVVVVDATATPGIDEERQTEVCFAIWDELSRHRGFTRFVEADDLWAKPLQFYAKLSAYLQLTSAVVVVLLPVLRGLQPPVRHLDQYPGFARSHLVFFAECSDPRAISAWSRSRVDGGTLQERLLDLTLTPLRAEDATRYLEARMGRMDTIGRHFRFSTDVVTAMISEAPDDPWPIARLQHYLGRVYDQHLRQATAVPESVLTPEQMHDYFWGSVRRGEPAGEPPVDPACGGGAGATPSGDDDEQ